ncbi:MAG: hypothetical protein WD025_04750 [Bacteriovoracaceae bacterium]
MRLKILVLLFCLFPVNHLAQALPIDWNGAVGFDTNVIKNIKRTTDACAEVDGSYCPGDDEGNGRYQSFTLKLNPTIIVNDSASLKAELSTGQIRGGFMGEDTTAQDQSSYFAQSPSGEQTLAINQFYAELYADTALFKVGKFSKNFGLGAMISGGDDIWDRYFSVYNGVEARFNLGKFSIVPVWAKIQTPNPAETTEDMHTGKYDTTETGITAAYEDLNNNFKFSLYYGIREVETNSDLYGTDTGPSEVTLIDIFFEKAWNNFTIAMEIPMMTGEVGTIYDVNDEAKDIDTNAYILETSYQLNPRWLLGLNGGMVKGEDGEDQFSALYLHPNYKIAELMFRYNYQAFQQADQSIFNASVNNANYAKLFAHYKSDAWVWKLAFIMAKANETASTGNQFYNHETNSFTEANADQSDDMGMELDVSFDYIWNPGIIVTGYVGHWMVGDYYGFTNTADGVETADVTATGLRLSMEF